MMVPVPRQPFWARLDPTAAKQQQTVASLPNRVYLGGGLDAVLARAAQLPPLANSHPLQSPPPRETVTSMFF